PVDPAVPVGSAVAVGSDTTAVEVEPAVVVGAAEVDGAAVSLGDASTLALGSAVPLVGVGNSVIQRLYTLGAALDVGAADAAVVATAVDVANVPGWSSSTIALISSV
uniref:hypothetical protein n=1 Tax=Mycobacterium pseudoshottsii TaxID=265949 RepID=UPI0021F2B36D